MDSKIDAWLAEQCGLLVLAARRGIPQADAPALGVQWDARFSVLCPAEWEQPPLSALMYTYGGGQYARPAFIPPRQISPTKPLAEYFAVLEYKRFPGWTATWKSDSGQERKSLLPRLEERLLKCIQRAGAAASLISLLWWELLGRTGARSQRRLSCQGLTALTSTCGSCSWSGALSFFIVHQ